MMNGEKEYLAFREIGDREVIVVDGLHPKATVLSHWKGANKHANIAADTSGEIVLNAIKSGFSGLDQKYVSATHFDIDGFVGVFALFFQELAIQHEDVLREMAIIGDFREYDPQRKGSDLALKLCCWINKVERDKFYRPFEDKDEIDSCVPKFDYFLSLFPSVLKDPEQFKEDWQVEYELVKEGLTKIIKKEYFKDIGLVTIDADTPLHYYALFSETNGFDIVLTCYPENRYELELKYTTWIDLATRPNLPRINLKPLAEKLNHLEGSDFVWAADKITDTGPILRLEKDTLSKSDRYANPTERTIYSSSIEKSDFQDLVIDYFRTAFKGIAPKRFWTWEEMKKINSQMGN